MKNLWGFMNVDRCGHASVCPDVEARSQVGVVPQVIGLLDLFFGWGEA